jgi:hypothetical protein
MSEAENPVVASLAGKSQHPYSSIAISPDRIHAVAAGKDTLRVFSSWSSRSKRDKIAPDIAGELNVHSLPQIPIVLMLGMT